MSKHKDILELKWGTIKAVDFHSEKALSLLREYESLGCSAGCMTQQDTPRQKEIIVEMIDICHKVIDSWTEKKMDKEAAKKYVLEYGKD